MLKTIKAGNVGNKTRIRGGVYSDKVIFCNSEVEMEFGCEGVGNPVEFRQLAELELLLPSLGYRKELPLSDDDDSFTNFDAKKLSNAFAYCLLAADNYSSRYALGGVAWDAESLVGTDGRRLHSIEIGNSNGSGIIPTNGVKAIISAISEHKEKTVYVKFDGAFVIVRGKCWKLACRLVEGRYPNWRICIPEKLHQSESPKFTKQFKGELKATIKRVKLEEQVYLSTLSKSERKSYDGKNGIAKIEIEGRIFDANYVLDGIDNIQSPTFFPMLNDDPNGACKFGDCVVMPMAK